MSKIAKPIASVAVICVLLFAILHVVPLPFSASMLTENPQPISLKGIDRTRKVEGEIKWDNPKIKLSGFTAHADITGTFVDSAMILDQLINPETEIAVIDKSKLKVWQRTNSTLACQGLSEGLACTGKIRMRIDTFLGKIKNTLTVDTLSSSELADNEITFRHRITSGAGVPSLIIDALNDELAEKDRTKALPKFFAEHNVDVTHHAFTGNSTDDTLGVTLSLKMPLSQLLKSIF